MSKKVTQIVVVLLLLVGLPLVSWIFLKDGLDFVLDTKSRLTVKAHLPKSTEYFERGRMQVFYPKESFSDRLKPLVDHFSDREDVLVFTETDQMMGEIADTLALVAEKSMLSREEHVAFLVDTLGRIVHAYNVDKDQDMAQLTEDIVFLLPPEEKKDFHLRREKEK